MYKVKNLLFFIIYFLLNPRLALLISKKVYIPIYIQFEWLKKYKFKTVVDVGAHKGKTLKVFKYLFPQAHFYAFEPSRENYNRLKNSFSGKNMHIEKYALSNETKKALFFHYSNDSLSSLLEKTKQYELSVKLTGKDSVETTTLDKYFRKIKLRTPIFLKIDTQGSEGDILKGGQKFLSNVTLIHIELSFKEFYKDQDVFPQIYEYLANEGFDFLGQVRESHFYPLFSPEEQINAVFINNKLVKGMN